LAQAKEGVDPIGVAASNRHCVSNKKEEVKMEFEEPEKSGSLLFGRVSKAARWAR